MSDADSKYGNPLELGPLNLWKSIRKTWYFRSAATKTEKFLEK